jgi:hypothetical protein
MPTVMQRSGQVMGQCFQALVLQMVRLCKLVNNLLVKFIHTYLNAVCFYNLLAKTKQSIKHWLVQYTNQVLLIKVGLIIALHKVGQLGQRLATIAHKIRQHAIQAWRQGN